MADVRVAALPGRGRRLGPRDRRPAQPVLGRGQRLPEHPAGYRGVLVFHALLVVALLLRRRPQTAVFAAAAGIAVLIFTQILKAGILRDRPDNTIVLTNTAEFPSGHVASTAAFLVVVALLVGRAWGWVIAGVRSAGHDGQPHLTCPRTGSWTPWEAFAWRSRWCSCSGCSAKTCAYQENGDARRLLTWRARASRSRRAAAHLESES